MDESRAATTPLGGAALPPTYSTSLHPLLAELFEPPPFSATAQDTELSVTGRSRHSGRDVIVARARFRDWATRHPYEFENFPPADDYELFIDSERGVLIRRSCRFDGREFSVCEFLDVTFDENFEPTIFRRPQDR